MVRSDGEPLVAIFWARGSLGPRTTFCFTARMTAQAAAEARADSQPKQLQAGLLRRIWPPVAAAHRHMLCKRPLRLHQLCCQCQQKRHAKPLLTTSSTLPRRCSSSVQRQGLRFDAASIVTTAQRELLAEVAAVVGKTLRAARQHGTVVLVTNAERGWIELSCQMSAYARPLARQRQARVGTHHL